MSEPQVKPWERFLEFLVESMRIFKGFSMALDAKKIVFALVAVVLWACGALLINLVANESWLLMGGAAVAAIVMVFVILARTGSETASKNFILSLVGTILGIIVLALILWWATKDSTVGLAKVMHLVWGLAVAALFGTGICRIAALNSAADETLGPRETARFALKKLSTSIWTLLVPVLAVIAFGLVLIVISAVSRIPLVGHVWYVIIGILYIVPLVIGLFFAAVMLVYFPSLILFQPAIAAEGNDSFDAISRSYSYVFGRPWRLAFYALVAFIYARIVLSVAALLVIMAGKLTNWFMGTGVDPEMIRKVNALDLGAILGNPFGADMPVWNAVSHFVTRGEVSKSFTDAGHVGGGLIVFWQHILLAIFLAFALSLLYSLITQIYFLMRKAVDGTPFEEVYIETPEEEEFAAEFEGVAAPAEVEEPEEEEEDEEEPPKQEKEEEDEPIDLAEGKPPLDIDEEPPKKG